MNLFLGGKEIQLFLTINTTRRIVNNSMGKYEKTHQNLITAGQDFSLRTPIGMAIVLMGH